ncbi:MAG: hypothetical protein IPI55_08840 [Flavobacteriales bacterium]|nr:hypothetical protein [Flavobacteriales bacterium]
MKPIVPTCIVLHLLLWCSAAYAQSLKATQTKTPAAYACMFSIGIGLDLPSLNHARGYYAYRDKDVNGTQVPNLWHNAYVRYRYMRFGQLTPMLGLGYHPTERWDIAIGMGRSAFAGKYSSLSLTRAYLNANYRPALGFSKKMRPVCGLQFSMDLRDYWENFYEGSYYDQTSTSLTVGLLTGLRFATGRWLWGADLTTVLLSRTTGRYHILRGPSYNPSSSGYEVSGDYEHTMGLPEALQYGYAFGHVALHCSYTIIER